MAGVGATGVGANPNPDRRISPLSPTGDLGWDFR